MDAGQEAVVVPKDKMASAGIPNLYIRKGVYYVLKAVGGKDRKASTKVQVGEKDSLKRAIKRQHEIEQSWGLEIERQGRVPTFREWAATYALLKEGKDTEATLLLRNRAVAYAQMWGFQGKPFGDYPLDRITPVMAESYLAFRATQQVRNPSADKAVASGTPRKAPRKLLAPTSVQKDRQMLQAVFNAAIKRHVVVMPYGNPFAHIDRLERKDTVREGILSHDDETRLMAQLKPFYQCWLQFMLFSGLRVNETKYLRPEHINRERGYIQVLGSVIVGGKKVNVAKKGKARKVPLYPEALQAIDTQLQDTPGTLWGISADTVGQVIERAAKRAGIPHLTPHTLRHTFATRYLLAGGGIYALSKVLGHSSVTVTELHYAQVVPQDVVELSRGLVLRPLTTEQAA